MADSNQLLSRRFSDLEGEIRLEEIRIKELKENMASLKRQESMIRLENQEYVSFLRKDNTKDLGLISSSDKYEEQVELFKKDLEQLLDDHNNSVKVKERQLNEKDVTLRRLTALILTFQTLQNSKKKQTAYSDELENEFKSIRQFNSRQIHSVRYNHKSEKVALEKSHASQVTDVVENSKKNARIHVEGELLCILQSNEALKTDLLLLMKKHADLEEQKFRLHQLKLKFSLSHL